MIYFDNSATTKPFNEVINSFVKVSTDYYGNPSSLHQLGGMAQQLLTQARNQIAKLLKAKSTEILFTSGGTESNNLAIKGTALMYRSRGKHIITTEIEHASVYEAMDQLKQLGYIITYLKPDQDGRISVRDVESALREDTILVSVIHVNNEVGTIQPIKEIGALLKDYPKVLFHVDHVQGVCKVPLNFHECGIDLCSISGHKFHGLKGTGALFLRDTLQISPLFSGGGQELKHRSGTENVAGIVAMAKALRLSMDLRAEKLSVMMEIMKRLRDDLQKIDEVTIHSPNEGSAPHILNLSIRGFKGEVFVHSLEEKGIYVSTTSACSSKQAAVSKTLLAMGISAEEAKSAIRISLSFNNTMDEALQAISALKESIKHLGEVMN
ncbi:cysteine desulfurase family protein [Bacillus sp. 1NLA3E]|uniref:cysteine desulfurase family protein n=1 Tax=Bacillus sp. 1NLA3E TaxID=666686 RepID=UPI000247E78E|nr:cysteine desulfurase family protein [Bacillus sp. 1NLA3E]AGK55213.1 cysteine desulfurase [Bacillus sp. 1NLA3E]